MRKVDLLIIDYKIEGFKRYAVDLCRQLRNINNDIVIAGCYIESSDKTELEGFDFVFCAQDYNLDPRIIFQKFEVKSIMTFAHRIFDYMFTFEAHKKRMIVFNFQHALYQSNTTISSLSSENLIMLIKKKQEQVKHYLKCLYHIADGKANILCKMIYDLLRHQSIYHVINKYVGKDCNADVSFVFGEYWKTFYKCQYFENCSEFEIVGYPELEGDTVKVEKNLFQHSNLPILCYLAQTSVEDGVLDEKEMLSFLDKLVEILSNYNLIIKFHPRSNKSLYDKLLNQEFKGAVIEWDQNGFPLADGYIGHDSTVIGRAMYITDKVLVSRLREDRISPFEQYGNYVCTTEMNVLEEINKMMKNELSDISTNLAGYMYKNENGAINQTAKKIISIIYKGD